MSACQCCLQCKSSWSTVIRGRAEASAAGARGLGGRREDQEGSDRAIERESNKMILGSRSKCRTERAPSTDGVLKEVPHLLSLGAEGIYLIL